MDCSDVSLCPIPVQNKILLRVKGQIQGSSACLLFIGHSGQHCDGNCTGLSRTSAAGHKKAFLVGAVLATTLECSLQLPGDRRGR